MGVPPDQWRSTTFRRSGPYIEKAKAMMDRRVLRLLLGLFVASLGTLARSAPPPPPPQFAQDIAEQLVATPSEKNFASYSGLMANDLTVIENGHTIAASKAEWLSTERTRLGRVDRFVYGFSVDGRSVLILDRSDDRSDEHCPGGDKCIFDPRWVARAIRYEIGADHLIHQIRILETDSIMQTPRE